MSDDVMEILDKLRRLCVSDEAFVEAVDRAVERGDEIVIAYAQGTLDNVDQSWPELERALARWCPAGGPHVLDEDHTHCIECGVTRPKPEPREP